MNFSGRDADVIALVPIRGGSKGLPGKNTRIFAGLPLYLRAVQQGLRVANTCVVSTDIEEVLTAPAADGCVLLRRGEGLAADHVDMDAVIFDVISRLNLSASTTVVLLQATSPLREDDDVVACINRFRSGLYELVMSVCEADAGILKYGILEDGDFVPVSKPEYCFANRQSLPRVMRPNGAVYVFAVGSFLKNGGLATDRIGAVEMPLQRSADIDSLKDFQMAEKFLLNGS